MAWDLILQASHQTQAFRLSCYFNSEGLRRRVFGSENFAQAARELGPYTAHAGPALVLFEGVQSPEQVLTWFNSPEGSTVRRHVKRLYWLPHHAPQQRHEQLEQTAPPVLQQHNQQEQDGGLNAAQQACRSGQAQKGICAADSATAAKRATMQDNATPITRDTLIESITAAGPGEPGTVYRLHCHPKALEKMLQDQLPLDFQLHPTKCTHVLQVVEAEHWLRWCVVPSSWQYRQSCEEPKALPQAVAHAVNKLDEALLVSGLRSHLGGRLRAAVDVGAAPGAWSMYLARFTDLVVAVDPAQLHEDAMLDNIVHLKLKGEEAVPHVQQLLGEGQADVLTCDMNCHPHRASKVIQPLLPLIRPGGVVILTLKFMGTARDRGQMEQQLRQAFAGELEQGRVFWLLANTVCEQTWIAVKAGGHK